MKKTTLNRNLQCGFSLVEAAVVLVIVGLLIGGVLRGTELIAAGRVRNVIDQVRTVQVAYYAFQDRYSALPGDLTDPQAKLINANTSPAVNVPGDGWVPIDDSQQFFNNVSQAGFLSCTVCMTKQAVGSNPTAAFSPVNLFGQPLAFAFPASVPATNAVGAYYLSSLPNEGSKAMATTGGFIDSKALSEIDRKLDDGNPASGQFRFSGKIPAVNGNISEPALTDCVTADAAVTYIWRTTRPGQCQGVLLL
jgi:type II secretory pathway pseudopilin PulG